MNQVCLGTLVAFTVITFTTPSFATPLPGSCPEPELKRNLNAKLCNLLSQARKLNSSYSQALGYDPISSNARVSQELDATDTCLEQFFHQLNVYYKLFGKLDVCYKTQRVSERERPLQRVMTALNYVRSGVTTYCSDANQKSASVCSTLNANEDLPYLTFDESMNVDDADIYGTSLARRLYGRTQAFQLDNCGRRKRQSGKNKSKGKKGRRGGKKGRKQGKQLFSTGQPSLSTQEPKPDSAWTAEPPREALSDLLDVDVTSNPTLAQKEKAVDQKTDRKSEKARRRQESQNGKNVGKGRKQQKDKRKQSQEKREKRKQERKQQGQNLSSGKRND